MNRRIQPTFYLRKDKVNKSGKMPLYVRFPRIDGEEPKFSIGKAHFSAQEWDNDANLPIDGFWRSELQKELIRIERAICRCYEDGIVITKSKLKEIAVDKKETNAKSAKTPNPQTALFIDYYVECIEKKLNNGQIRQSTYKAHLTTINAMRCFNPNLKVKDINAETLKRFVEYLKTRNSAKTKDSSSTVINRLAQIKSVIHYIEALGINIENPFKTNDIHIEKAGSNDVYLNDEELYRMVRLLSQRKEKQINNKEYSVLMMFLFGCATGMRFSDVHSLKWSNLNFEHRNVVLEFLCTKTRKMNYIPLNPMAEDIVCRSAYEWKDDYEYNKTLFVRTYSNTTVNKTLKTLAKKARINKNFTFHASRRTFATYCRDNNLTRDLRKTTLGHSGDVTDRYEQWNAYEASKAKDSFAFLDIEKIRQNYINANKSMGV